MITGPGTLAQRALLAGIIALGVTLQPPPANALDRGLVGAIVGGLAAAMFSGHMARRYHYSHVSRTHVRSAHSDKAAHTRRSRAYSGEGSAPQKTSDPFAGVTPSGTVQVKGQ
jgi:hypothetical protein